MSSDGQPQRVELDVRDVIAGMGDSDKDDYDPEGDEDLEEADNSPFTLAVALAQPTVEHYRTEDLHGLIYDGAIDLSPPYQRDVVWSDEKQSSLIDSLLRNFWIPPVVFAENTDDYGYKIRVCVDGKQRLTSILRFIDGHIPYRDPNGTRWYYTLPPSRKTKAEHMPELYRRQFKAKMITCVNYGNITREMEREMFTRVQLGMVLTHAERLQAICTPRADWVRELLEKHAPLDGGLTHSLPKWNTKRGGAFQCIAQLAYCCHLLPEQTEPDAPKITPWLTAPQEPSDGLKRRVSDALSALQRIVTTPSLNAVVSDITQGVAPVEFVFLGILLYMMSDNTIQARAAAAYRMRTHLRRRHTDIFRRKNVFLTLWAYIDCTLDEVDGLEASVRRVTRVRHSKRSYAEIDDRVEERPTKSRKGPTRSPS